MWGLVTGHIKRALRMAHPAAVAAFLVTAVPWYALCSARNPDFLHTFFVMHNVERFTSPVFHHTQPFWFYVPVLIAALLPWTPLGVATFRDARSAIAEGDWKNVQEFISAAGSYSCFYFSAFRNRNCPDIFCRRFRR